MTIILSNTTGSIYNNHRSEQFVYVQQLIISVQTAVDIYYTCNN